MFLHHLRNSTGPKGTPLEYFRVPPSNFSTKGPPFQFFRHCETFFQISFSPKRPPSNFDDFATEWMKNLKVSPLVRQFGWTFGFFRYCRREYFDTLKSFCYFWALDMAPTWAVPGLFNLRILKSLWGGGKCYPKIECISAVQIMLRSITWD